MDLVLWGWVGQDLVLARLGWTGVCSAFFGGVGLEFVPLFWGIGLELVLLG